MPWGRYQEQANILQNDFYSKMFELRMEALKNYQKADDLKLSLYLQQNSETKQAFFNPPGSQGTMGATTMGRTTKAKMNLMGEFWDQRPTQNNKELKKVSLMVQEGGSFF